MQSWLLLTSPGSGVPSQSRGGVRVPTFLPIRFMAAFTGMGFTSANSSVISEWHQLQFGAPGRVLQIRGADVMGLSGATLDSTEITPLPPKGRRKF